MKTFDSFLLLTITLKTDAFYGIRLNQPRRPPTLVSSSSSLEPLLEESTLRAVTFHNLPKDQEPDLLCDFLMEIGACSAAIVDADRGTDKEQPLFAEPGVFPDPSESPTPVWNRCNVTAHFPASTDIPAVIDMVIDTFPDQYPDIINSRVEQVPNKDWVVHVQQSWTPIVVGERFVLRFPWHSQQDVSKATAGLKDLVELQLQGGIAFGTGEHPTTQLCLEWVAQAVTSLLEQDGRDVCVLDYGSGSGVLGMAACALDRDRVTSLGIDIDVDACRIANANALKNQVNMRNYLPPLVETDHDESKSLLLKAHAQAESMGNDGSTIILPDTLIGKQYDVCVANILAAPLVTLAKTLSDQVRPGGMLGLSGILAHQGQDVVDAYAAADFKNVRIERELNGWVLVTGQKIS